LPATVSSLPVVFASSGPGTGCASGTGPGHIGTCVYPGDGCHAGVCACRTANPETTQRAMIKGFLTIHLACNPRLLTQQSKRALGLLSQEGTQIVKEVFSP
jgi:hypothetical protein